MAAVGARAAIMGLQRASEPHPFFQNQPIPHRAVKLAEIGDDVETISQPTDSNHSKSRKRKSRPLVERASNTHLPQLPTNDSLMDVKSAACLVVEGNMDQTPKKKVLKLNSNGKLLSSPPLLSATLLNAKEAVKTPPNERRKRIRGRSGKSSPSSLIAKLRYGGEDSKERVRVGSTISELLASTKKPLLLKDPSPSKTKRSPKKATHPFFYGKVNPTTSIKDTGVRTADKKVHTADTSVQSRLEEPGLDSSASKARSPQTKPPWKHITFSPARYTNHYNESSPTPWPPTDMQRVDDVPFNQNVRFPVLTSAFQMYKSKGRAAGQILGEGDDILRRASHAYSESLRGLSLCAARHPARVVFSGPEMSLRLEKNLLVGKTHLATQKLRSSLSTAVTAFDQGRCDQSSWTVKSSPSSAAEVLQPGPEAAVLRDWVKNLTITSVEGSPIADKIQLSKSQKRKRGRPKRPNDADGFLVASGDEADELTEIGQSTRESTPFIDDVKRSVLRAGAIISSHHKGQIKNTILLSGPTGCGKTASVYAVAKELGFEVFEIHPGTRRGAKEILEKVGDMTQNHLVQHQKGENSMEEAPATPIDDAMVQDEIASGKQRTMNGFFQTQSKATSKIGRKRKAANQDDQKPESTVKKPRKAQKQSLILLEEVDILFEEDKSFWSGVMSLISQSKRPIILTCNDESALPLDELPLHGILRYSAPPEDLATDYLLTLAASEGHELEREAITYLYRSQQHDLRSTITELDFWCQMGIGSRKGGLDWMLDRRRSSGSNGTVTTRPRVFSRNTYLRGMGLTSQQPEIDPEQHVFDAYQQLGISIDIWTADAHRKFTASTNIRDASITADLYSDLDLCQLPTFSTDPSELQLRIAASLTTRLSPHPPTANDITNAYIQPSAPSKLTRSTLTQIFEPLTDEKPTFPPTTGRLAPTLDAPLSTLTTDVAPYIRSIIAHERKWGAPLSVPKRNTRASRLPKGYFPKKTNATFVLMTGGEGWQDLWVRPGGSEVETTGECESGDVDVDVDDE
jgi:DNA polymerase III delta prime subunit